MSIDVWIRDSPQHDAVGALPAGVQLHPIPNEGPPPPEILDAQFVVPPFDSPAVLKMLAQMPRLAVVQSISAGTETLQPWIPQGVTLCSARGTRDVAVAEWILAAILAMESDCRPSLGVRPSTHGHTNCCRSWQAGTRSWSATDRSGNPWPSD